jgi:hypothetical protein
MTRLAPARSNRTEYTPTRKEDAMAKKKDKKKDKKRKSKK